MIRVLVVCFCSAACLLALGCASKPEVPDEQQTREYRSTKNGESEATAPEATEMKSAESPGVIKATGPVATIDGKPVSAEEFNKEIERIVASGLPPALVGQAAPQIVQKLVDRRLIEDEIERQNVQVTDAEVEAKMQEVREEFAKASEKMGQQASLETLVQQLGITEQELRDSIEQSIAIEKMLQKRGVNDPDPKEVRAFYDDNKTQFEQPEQVHARHILIKVDQGADEATWEAAKKRAETIRTEAVKKGTDFAALAKEKSEGPSAPEGGDLGFFARGRMVPEFEKAAFELKPGEISEPVRSDFGWHIIKVEEKKESGPVPFEEVDEELTAQMKNQRVNEALLAFLDELRSSRKVEIHEENIAQ